MLNKLGLYTLVAKAQIKHKLHDEEGSEILQVIGMAAAVAAVLAGVIAAGQDKGEGIGNALWDALKDMVEKF